MQRPLKYEIKRKILLHADSLFEALGVELTDEQREVVITKRKRYKIEAKNAQRARKVPPHARKGKSSLYFPYTERGAEKPRGKYGRRKSK